MKKTTTLFLLFILSSVNAQFYEDFENGVPGKLEQIYLKGATTWIDFGLSAINVDEALSDSNSAVFFNGMSTTDVVTCLQTPILDLSNPEVCLDFLYLQKLKTDGYSNSLKIELSVDAGATYIEIAAYNQTDNDVKNMHIDLAQYKPSTSSILRFKSIQTNPLDGHPIVIDDISIKENVIKANKLVNSVLSDEIKVSPNPSNGIFSITINEPSTITIFDSNGRLIFNTMKLSNDSTIDLYQFSAGIYFARINSVDDQVIKKIIIQ
jgi:hypothetical protein